MSDVLGLEFVVHIRLRINFVVHNNTHHCGGEHDRAIVVSYVHEYVRIRMYDCESQE